MATTYKVKSGDTLSKIGAQFGVDWKKITGYKSGNPNLIYPGEVLTIPTSTSVPSTTTPVSFGLPTGGITSGIPNIPPVETVGASVEGIKPVVGQPGVSGGVSTSPVGTIGTWISSTTGQGYSGRKMNVNDQPAGGITPVAPTTPTITPPVTTPPTAPTVPTTPTTLTTPTTSTTTPTVGTQAGQEDIPAQIQNVQAQITNLQEQVKLATEAGYGAGTGLQIPGTEGYDVTTDPLVVKATEILDDKGVDIDSDKTVTNPTASWQTTYQDLFTKLGLDTVKTQIDENIAKIQALDDELADKIAEVNENPWISEGLRAKQVAGLQEKYADKKQALTSALTLYQNTYNEGRQEAQFLVTTALSQYNTERTFDLNEQKMLADQAEAAAKALKDLTTVDTQVVEAGGRKLLIDTQTGKTIADLGAVTVSPKTTPVSETGANYNTRLNQEISSLYSGRYGTEGAREKVINILKAEFPEIDVAKDIYNRVPDGYEAQIKTSGASSASDFYDSL